MSEIRKLVTWSVKTGLAIGAAAAAVVFVVAVIDRRPR